MDKDKEVKDEDKDKEQDKVEAPPEVEELPAKVEGGQALEPLQPKTEEQKDDTKEEDKEPELPLLQQVPQVVFENEYNENKLTLQALCTLNRIKYEDNTQRSIERLYELYLKEYNEIIENAKAQRRYDQLIANEKKN